MESIVAEKLVTRALKEYDRVKEELNKPHRDFVMIATCELVKNAISELLAAYLFENDIQNFNRRDLLSMQKQCASIDDRFMGLKLAPIALLCDEESATYTNAIDEERLNRYVLTLEDVKKLVMASLQKRSERLLL